MFELFRTTAERLGGRSKLEVLCKDDRPPSYRAVKESSTDFQAAKAIMYARFRLNGFGKWVSKPLEEEMFTWSTGSGAVSSISSFTTTSIGWRVVLWYTSIHSNLNVFLFCAILYRVMVLPPRQWICFVSVYFLSSIRISLWTWSDIYDVSVFIFKFDVEMFHQCFPSCVWLCNVRYDSLHCMIVSRWPFLGAWTGFPPSQKCQSIIDQSRANWVKLKRSCEQNRSYFFLMYWRVWYWLFSRCIYRVRPALPDCMSNSTHFVYSWPRKASSWELQPLW